MEQRFIDFFHGYVRIRIQGTFYDRFLNICAFNEIRLWNIVPADGAYEACVSKKDFFRLREIVRKSHTRIQIIKRIGFPFFVHQYRARGACLCGAFAAVLFMAWLSAHIWKISIEGNQSQTDDVIFEYLEQEGISHGIWKNQVDTRILSDQLRNYFTQFSWVSAELSGTRLVIYVKEGVLSADGEDAGEEESAADTDESLTGIAASKAGTVVSVFVRKGLSTVSVGDSVEEGDLLVSGQIPVYNDDGEIIAWQEVPADADIILRTKTLYHDEVAYEAEQKSYTGRSKERCSIRICQTTFALPGSFSSFSLCEVTGVITQMKLSDNYYLPIYFCKYTALEYEILKYIRTEEQAREILEDNLSIFIEKLPLVPAPVY